MMKTKIESIWERLRSEKREPSEEKQLGKIVLVDENHPFNLYAGIDEEERFLLALNLKERPQSVQIKSDAFHCFRQRRLDQTWFLVLALEQSSLAPVFGRLCQDLIDTAWSTQNELELERLFIERLLLWKRLFDMGSQGLLDESKIRGLIGELWMLKSLVYSSKYSSEAIVAAWVGPLAAPQDFQFDDGSIEVKSVAQSMPTLKISSLEQLDCQNPLSLYVVKLQKSDNASEFFVTLNSLVAEIEGMLDPIALPVFNERLLEAGYVEHPHYDSYQYEVTSFDGYEVTEAFPKLTSAGVDIGIVTATYTVSLESIEPFRMRT